MFQKSLSIIASLVVFLSAESALAQGDLLVAPTRLVLGGQQGSEVVVSNSGTKTSSYRISLVIRRMDEKGQINNVEDGQASAPEAATLEMINYAPRKITLAPGQAQTVRIGVRAPVDLAAGEYRAHLLFRAIPDARPEAATDAQQTPPSDGMSISLTPIYGVAIPVIVRIGDVPGEARLVSAQRVTLDGQAGVLVDLGREGKRSIYGTLSVAPMGDTKSLVQLKGLAVYPELAHRQIFLPVDAKLLDAHRTGLVARFAETDPAGKAAVAEAPVN